jgi:hypothetical protein
MIKKIMIMLLCIICLSPLILAQDYKLDVTPIKESFSAEEEITLKVSLLDSNNNPINDNVLVILTNSEQGRYHEETIISNKIVGVDLGEGANAGYWSISANYNDAESSGFFSIEEKELIKFELNEGILIVTNIGNTKYTKTIQIIIGDTMGTRTPNLDVGDSVTYKLIAPEGLYNIKVTDGETTIMKNEVELAGTGQAIGALDERSSQRSPLTGGISPDEEDDIAILNYMKQSKFVYVFIAAVFIAFILLLIERKYFKKVHVR